MGIFHTVVASRLFEIVWPASIKSDYFQYFIYAVKMSVIVIDSTVKQFTQVYISRKVYIEFKYSNLYIGVLKKNL